MKNPLIAYAMVFGTLTGIGLAQQTGPYKVIKTAKVGGEGG